MFQIIKISLNESVTDRTTCPVIQGFVRSIPNSDRTLSVHRPLFAALISIENCTKNMSKIFVALYSIFYTYCYYNFNP